MIDCVVGEKKNKLVCYEGDEKTMYKQTNKQTNKKTNKQKINDSSLISILLEFDRHFDGRFQSNSLNMRTFLFSGL